MEDLLPKISALLFKYGIKSITMDDIARHLAISKKTLYLHFKNKRDVVQQVGEYELNREFTEIDSLCKSETPVIDQFWAITRYMVNRRLRVSDTLIYAFNKYYPDIIGDISTRRKKHLNTVIINNIKTGIDQGLYREDLDLDTLLFYYSFLLTFSNLDIFDNWFNIENEKRFFNIFDYHLRAIASAKGLQYFEKEFSPTTM
ncbi:MAG: TetR/AcrR family transcriptional regulator [Bacteroidales bacterium]|nr:TetR/AcrR family transcriptional regulator [Bacteroidales bacterium]